MNLNNAHFDTKNGVIRPKTSDLHKQTRMVLAS